jgi:hypothetical protein
MRNETFVRACLPGRRYANQAVRVAVATLTVLFVFVAACSDGGSANEIIGVITEVRLNAQNEVESIRVRDRDDHMWDLPVQFDPGSEVPGYHLEEHRAQRLPVVVRIRESANGPYASEINDVDPHE